MFSGMLNLLSPSRMHWDQVVDPIITYYHSKMNHMIFGNQPETPGK
jgi:hypothetical protein